MPSAIGMPAAAPRQRPRRRYRDGPGGAYRTATARLLQRQHRRPRQRPRRTATATAVPTATATPVPTATATPTSTATAPPTPTATAPPAHRNGHAGAYRDGHAGVRRTPVPTATATPVPTASTEPTTTATPTPTDPHIVERFICKFQRYRSSPSVPRRRFRSSWDYHDQIRERAGINAQRDNRPPRLLPRSRSYGWRLCTTRVIISTLKATLSQERMPVQCLMRQQAALELIDDGTLATM